MNRVCVRIRAKKSNRKVRVTEDDVISKVNSQRVGSIEEAGCLRHHSARCSLVEGTRLARDPVGGHFSPSWCEFDEQHAWDSRTGLKESNV